VEDIVDTEVDIDLVEEADPLQLKQKKNLSAAVQYLKAWQP
jgi:hypothetical protein